MAPIPRHGLLRSIRRWDLVAVVLNGVIGAGIFGLPATMFSLIGPESIFAFGACALCAAVLVISFIEVSSRFTATGGPYLYAREAFGPTVGFTVGWLVWTARITSFAGNCNLLPAYLGLFFPALASGVARALLIACVVVAIGWLNVRGVSVAASASNALAIGKLLPLLLFVAVGLFFVQPARFAFSTWVPLHSFSQSVLLLLYAFTGFEMAVIPGGEIRNPRRTVPAALAIGMGMVVTLYVLIQVVCIGVLPGLATSERPLADAAALYFGASGAIVMTAGMVISLAGNLNVLILSASRVIFAMAERHEIPSVFAWIHPRYGTPALSIIVTSAIMLGLTLSGTFVYLITLSAVSRLVTYFATCAAVPVLRRRSDVPPAALPMPGGLTIALIGMAICVWLLSASTAKAARDTLLAVVIGLGLFWIARRFRGKNIDASDTALPEECTNSS
jgi:basic amino acid/polyamine antiporter, APA family